MSRPNLADLEKALNGKQLFKGTLKELKGHIESMTHHFRADIVEFNRDLDQQASFSLSQQMESDKQRLKLDDTRKLISDLKVEYQFKKASADYKYEQDKAMVIYKYIHELHRLKKREGEPPHLFELDVEDRAWVLEMAQKVFVPYPKY